MYRGGVGDGGGADRKHWVDLFALMDRDGTRNLTAREQGTRMRQAKSNTGDGVHGFN